MSENIKPSEVSSVLLEQLKGIDTSLHFEEVGTVLQVSDGVVRIYGLRNAEAEELLEFENGVKAIRTNKIEQPSPNLMDLILGHRIDLVIDTPTQGRDKSRDGFLIRRVSIETGVNCLTSLDTARALVGSLETKMRTGQLSIVDIAELDREKAKEHRAHTAEG